MLDYLKRLLIVFLMALCVCMIIIGGRVQAADFNIENETSDWYFPAQGKISDVFDSRGGVHKGIDIAGDPKTPVYAAESGKVVRSYYSQSYGNVVFLHHQNGFETVYAHLNTRMVEEGQIVGKGDQVGLVGNTGNSTGSHLHFEIHQGDWTIEKENAIDPFRVFGKGEIGQFVFALHHDPYGIVDVAGTVEEPKEQVTLTSFYIPAANNNTIHTPNFAITQVESEITQSVKEDQHFSGEKGSEYIVKKGDTLTKISQMFHVPLQELLELNKITNEDLIIVNQKLIIHQLS